MQPFAGDFWAAPRHFFAVLLDVTQEKITQVRPKRHGEGAMFSYEDAAKAARFFVCFPMPPAIPFVSRRFCGYMSLPGRSYNFYKNLKNYDFERRASLTSAHGEWYNF